MEPVMVRDGRGVTVRLVLLVGLSVTALGYLGLRIWTGQGAVLPEASWGAVVVLVFMASGVFFAGLPIRRFLRGRAKKPLNPMRAMRTLVLAQAAALTGPLVAGWYLAQALVLLPDYDIPSGPSKLVRLAALAAGGILMAVAGLAVQAMCRIDKDDKGDRGDRGEDDDHRGDRGGKQNGSRAR